MGGKIEKRIKNLNPRKSAQEILRRLQGYEFTQKSAKIESAQRVNPRKVAKFLKSGDLNPRKSALLKELRKLRAFGARAFSLLLLGVKNSAQRTFPGIAFFRRERKIVRGGIGNIHTHTGACIKGVGCRLVAEPAAEVRG
ncbi:MAG: hypothetical protein C4576_16000 [Desulfobacteraceae bacterium]|nr:MAG: hypothetical protein C4576_16000 [Desulfobacteraceae bacterium]